MVSPSGEGRVSKIDTYLNCAEVFAYRSTCIKRKYGAVIVKDDVVISTGYNGAPRGFDNCCDLGKCPRMELGMHQEKGMSFVKLFMQSKMRCLTAQDSRPSEQIFT